MQKNSQVIKIGNVDFKLDKDKYVYKFNLGEKRISIYLNIEEESSVFIKYKNACEKLLNNFEEKYKEILKECADKLTVTANVWNEEDEHIITKEEFIQRISKSDVEIYFIYDSLNFDILDDDSLFLGHTITYSKNLDTNEISVDI